MDSIFNFLPYVGWVLLAIMILVFIHELGHFLFAKLFKMRVEKFSVGFPPKIIGTTIGETEYVLGLTPLGGYVKIVGMVDESMDTDQLSEEPQPYEFRAKPVWQRILVITGGVLFNIILAALIFISLTALYGKSYVPPTGAVQVVEGSVAHTMGLRTGDLISAVNGKPVDTLEGLGGLEELMLADPLIIDVVRDGVIESFQGPSDIMTQMNQQGSGGFGVRFDPAIVGYVSPDSPANTAGLVPGDHIVAIGDSTVSFFSDMAGYLLALEGNEFTLRFVRPDSVTGAISPELIRAPDSLQAVGGTTFEVNLAAANSSGQYLIGITQAVHVKEYGIVQSVGVGLSETWLQTRLVASSLKRIFVGQDNFRENIGGPVMIAKVTKEAADMGAPFFWNIVAMLSITLAIINILPIPALDGGHLVFLIYEGIFRREPSLKIRMLLQQIGMFVLLAFMVFVIFNDLLKL
ncbi:RIP metalloprotease RseP [bacterium]|nr:RIP metalloprotease RseP [bacterium]